jgi:hypothetical protein
MTPQLLRNIRRLEGHKVTGLLAGNGEPTPFSGELVSAPRRGAGTVWLVMEGTDRFVAPDELYDLHEA